MTPRTDPASRYIENHSEWVESDRVRVVVRPPEQPNGVIVFHDGPDGRVALHVKTEAYWLIGWLRSIWLRLHGVKP